MSAMQFMRRTHQLARFALVWFALSLAAASASPWINPQTIQIVCSSTMGMAVVVSDADGIVDPVSQSMQCPLCIGVGAPPPVPLLQWLSFALQVHVLPVLVAAPPALHSAAPLPARGPPPVL
jgi:hypothetical protein